MALFAGHFSFLAVACLLFFAAAAAGEQLLPATGADSQGKWAKSGVPRQQLSEQQDPELGTEAVGQPPLPPAQPSGRARRQHFRPLRDPSAGQLRAELASEEMLSVGTAAQEAASEGDPVMQYVVAFGKRIQGPVAGWQINPASWPGMADLRSAAMMAAFRLMWFAGMSVILWMLLIFYLANWYIKTMDKGRIKSPVVDLDGSQTLLETKNWSFGLFNCDSPSLCFFSFLSPVVRWAITMDSAGLVAPPEAFFRAVVIGVVGSLATHLVPGIGFFAYLAVLVHYRQKLRAKFEIASGTWKSIFEDCCIYCWCSPCAITQEARQIELAARFGHPAAAGWVAVVDEKSAA
mmetsp:Transcript_65008/g.141705  ORF Transcript_65008/g.141705 Transcript_65008/m.141705 type:complete len:348 (+) Transcript_65008:81-1124(+)|eukprot:CAMPEP_0170607916 /NCGR_PEP_ID=MMETSP0224-20130122/21307_1 /TAXON_ID=285029 /ORGANISM="Togula jolla, Strain CCCM 725" /LENGTH=347 /DNA_ID=CAMNT_0010933109 /DNA_START=45 /DNA_END=1088 /DNA_ORIENTATION=+